MAFNPTPEQHSAIYKDGSIIVSAAAGSGKTAVLVERVARLLCDPNSHVYADKLLIVTFTNAAAEELRYRIDKRLTAEFDKNPTDVYLQKQKILINNAKICTIDSFCIDFIRENFELAGISPAFKIADNVTINSICDFALSSVFNDHFETHDKEFIELLEFIGEKRDDSELRSCISKIYEFSRHIPFPDKWLDDIVTAYEEHANGRRNDWFTSALKVAKAYAIDAQLEFKEAISLLSTSPDAYSKYSENYEYFLSFSEELAGICDNGNWNDAFSYIKSLSPPKCKSLSEDEKTDDVNRSIKLRNSGKTKLTSATGVLYCPEEDLCSEYKILLPYIKKIILIVKEYDKKVSELFDERGILTFSMAEQTALSLLAKVEKGNIVPTENVSLFTDFFDAILVDEYQDTNTLQDTLFHFLSDNGKKLFCVGDMKQCIYKFRGSNPTNFLLKKESAVSIDADVFDGRMQRIDLGCNFRSRPEICDCINGIFKKILYKDNSGFDYDEREELVSRAEYVDSNETKIESHYLDFESINLNGDFESRRHAEAQAIADTICEIVSRPPFLKDGTTLRKAEYKDITILLRSLYEKGDIYAKVLKENGIPVSLLASEGIASDEVNTLISLLKILNNPSDDIALLTVLTSPIFNFTMDELARIRAHSPRGRYYSAVITAYKQENEKVRQFVDFLSRMRRKVHLSSLASIISDILDETGYLNIVSMCTGGDVKRNNLVSLQNIALNFEKEGKRDIRSFINYFETLKDRDFSVGTTDGNSVSIMTIHGSKGLQFPVCILANTTNQFNLKDVRSNVIINESHGISLDYYTSDGKTGKNTVLKSLMKYEETHDLAAEELRLFYVALTRAEEKLITFSTYKDLNDEIESKSVLLERAEAIDKVPYSVFRRNNSYADWITESYLLDGQKDVLLSDSGNDIIRIHRTLLKPEFQENLEVKALPDMDCAQKLNENYNFEYPFKELLGLQSKSSVTDIVHKADENEYRFTSRPAFLQESGLSTAEKGTAIHKVLQHIDFYAVPENLDAELERLYEYMYISEAEFEAIDREKLLSFFSDDLFKRCILSNEIKREMRFLTEFYATDIDTELDDKFSDEKVIVQGAVDLLFIEDDGVVIVDFKTDRSKNREELIAAYRQQLEIYSKACSKILSLPIKELYIYSFSLGEAIKL